MIKIEFKCIGYNEQDTVKNLVTISGPASSWQKWPALGISSKVAVGIKFAQARPQRGKKMGSFSPKIKWIGFFHDFSASKAFSCFFAAPSFGWAYGINHGKRRAPAFDLLLPVNGAS